MKFDQEFDKNCEDAADKLGVSTQTLRRWAKGGKVRCWRSPGGQFRFSDQDLDAFIAAGVIETSPDAVAS